MKLLTWNEQGEMDVGTTDIKDYLLEAIEEGYLTADEVLDEALKHISQKRLIQMVKDLEIYELPYDGSLDYMFSK